MSDLEKSKDEQIADLLHVAYFLCEAIYAHIAGEKSDDDLKLYVDNIAADEAFKMYLQHKYILKDMYNDPYANISIDHAESDQDVVDDTGDLIIKE